MTLAAVRDAKVVIDVGTIRTHFPPTGELVVLNNLLACVARFGTGEFVVPETLRDLCDEDLYEREGIHLQEIEHRDRSFRRLLEHCTIWFDSKVEDVLMKSPKFEATLRMRLTDDFSLRSDDEVREAIRGA